MTLGDLLTIFSHLINVSIFIYFSLILIKINALNTIGISISAFGIFMSLITNIIVILEKLRTNI